MNEDPQNTPSSSAVKLVDVLRFEYEELGLIAKDQSAPIDESPSEALKRLRIRLRSASMVRIAFLQAKMRKRLSLIYFTEKGTLSSEEEAVVEIKDETEHETKILDFAARLAAMREAAGTDTEQLRNLRWNCGYESYEIAEKVYLQKILRHAEKAIEKQEGIEARTKKDKEESDAGDETAGAAEAEKTTGGGDSIGSTIEALAEPEVLRLPAALCFSGGGIRSATFSLGVLQGLAKRGLIRKFDYLSTVSGGGYIGSWLSAWVARKGIRTAEDRLAGLGNENGEVEPGEITHLRSYGNYMSPRVGLFSPDLWTVLTVFLRNLLLVWAYIVPFMAAILLVPKLMVMIFRWEFPVPYRLEIFVVSSVVGAIGTAMMIYMRPYLREFFSIPRSLTSVLWVMLLCFAPIVATAIGMSYFWYAAMVAPEKAAGFMGYFDPGGSFYGLKWFALFGMGFFLGSYVLALIFKLIAHLIGRWRKSGPEHIETEEERKLRMARWRKYGKEMLITLFAGAISGILLYLAGQFLLDYNDWVGKERAVHFAAGYGTPIILSVFGLTGTVQIGLTSFLNDDMDREWFARFGAILALSIVGWSVIFTLMIFGPDVVGYVRCNMFQVPGYLLGIAGGISGLVTLLLGFMAGTPSDDKSKPKGRLEALAWIAPQVAAPVFLLFLIILIASATDLVMLVSAKWLYLNFPGSWILSIAPYWQMPEFVQAFVSNSLGLSELKGLSYIELPGRFVLVWFVLLCLTGSIFGYFININKFSFHAIYRERLIRAYLGASRYKERMETANRFTGLDSADNIQMCDLSTKGPFHVVNMTLNLNTSGPLRWAYRRAQSFTATPFFCGSSAMNDGLGAYRPSNEYGHNEQSDRSITLGTAAAISGAAVNPNMGYFTSSGAVMMLMAMFNIRLGWWLGNPANEDSWRESSPRFAPIPLLYEAIGNTGSTSPHINLSDGGHFENLGLYEMVLRRCRLIMLVDAGADPDYKFSDLGNAIHKIRVDQGVSIVFREGAKPAAGKACGIADILYSECDGAGLEDGVLIYIKPTITGKENFDISNYRKENDPFPHETTADQFFNEIQFESYRSLGEGMISRLVAAKEDNTNPVLVLKTLIANAEAVLANQKAEERAERESNREND